jgi:hypothetical protein
MVENYKFKVFMLQLIAQIEKGKIKDCPPKTRDECPKEYSALLYFPEFVNRKGIHRGMK